METLREISGGDESLQVEVRPAPSRVRSPRPRASTAGRVASGEARREAHPVTREALTDLGFVLGGPTGLGTGSTRLGRPVPSVRPAPAEEHPPRPVAHPDGSVTFTVHDLETDEEFVASISCPLYSARHPQSDELLRGHREWARGFDLFASDEYYARFCGARFDHLVSSQCHRLSLDAALVASHLQTWYFVYDDAQEEQHEHHPEGGSEESRIALGRHLDVLDGDMPHDADSRTLLAFADMLRQARKHVGGNRNPWYIRMVDHLRQYLYGTFAEGILDPPAGTNAALHWQARQTAVGLLPPNDFAAGAHHLNASHVNGNVFVQRMELLTLNHGVWVNDLLGLNRDQRYGLHNTIVILRNDFGLSLKQATRLAAHHCDQELCAYLTYERELPRLLGEAWPTVSATVGAYSEVLKNWARGLVDWSADSDRYHTGQDMSLAGA